MAILGILAPAGITPSAQARDAENACAPGWTTTFGCGGVINGVVECSAVFDDGLGGGPALYVGGLFERANGVVVNNIARWDGAKWTALGVGTDERVYSLAVFDHGTGPALYAAGSFTTAGGVAANRIARWNGSTWSAVGSGLNGSARCLEAVPAGMPLGPALFVGGGFTNAGGVSAMRVARWNGASWSAVGAGLNNTVNALRLWSSPTGTVLVAGGHFTMSGAAAANRLARWNGTNWAQVGGGANDSVATLLSWNEGSGGDTLFVGGKFSSVGGVAVSRLARWNGTSWSAIGSGVVAEEITALRLMDDGERDAQALYVGGFGLTSAGGIPASNLARWNGSAWSVPPSGPDSTVRSLQSFDDGSGHALFVMGSFVFVDGKIAGAIARWMQPTNSWSTLTTSVNQAVNALALFDDGVDCRPALYAGGAFTAAGDNMVASRIGRWDGRDWTPLGPGLNSTVFALAVYDDGGGPALYAGGQFTMSGSATMNRVGKWDGSAWSQLGGGAGSGTVQALAVFDDGTGRGTALHAGGSFQGVVGAPGSVGIARWNGTAWSSLGTGLKASGSSGSARAMAVGRIPAVDDEPALYVAGNFDNAGGAPCIGIARWNGTAWSNIVPGLSSIFALSVFDDGSGAGPALYAGGTFSQLGGSPLKYIARWDGVSTWSEVGGGMNQKVSALAVFDDGSGDGPALYAAGDFTMAGGQPAERVAKWNGRAWSSLGPSLASGSPVTLAAVPGGPGVPNELYLGGLFGTPIWTGDCYLARWVGCEPCVAADLDCDGQVDETDLALLLGAWAPEAACAGDLNGDGAVDGDDLGTLLGAWSLPK